MRNALALLALVALLCVSASLAQDDLPPRVVRSHSHALRKQYPAKTCQTLNTSQQFGAHQLNI